MQELRDFHNNSSYSRNQLSHFDRVQVGFMRFEDFLRPVPACYAMYKFVYFDSPDHYQAAMRSSVSAPGGLDELLMDYNDAAESVCGHLKKILPPFEWRGGASLLRRRLRLRNFPSGADKPLPGGSRESPIAFDLHVVQHSLRSRLKEFSQLSRKTFYSAALQRLYDANSKYGNLSGLQDCKRGSSCP